ncbi:MAG: helix-turn-helix domain-containing protein [Candidatus Odinarchaeota archaeon]
MSRNKISQDNKFITVLNELGLNENEALIYFTLLKEGNKGATVNELMHNLDDIFNRTTVYSIINKLIRLGCVKDAGPSKGSRKATKFKAIKASKFFSKLISNKQQELNKIKELKERFSDYLDIIYQNGMEYSIEELDDEIQIYLLPLIEKGWKVKSYLVKKDVPPFDYDVYDCMLYSPDAKIIQENSFHLFHFKHEIEHDKETLKFFTNALKKKTEEIIGYYSDIKNYHLEESEIEFFDRNFPAFVLRVKVEDLLNSDYFSDLKEISNIYKDFNPSNYVEIWKSITFPIKKDIYFLWAESNEILQEMVEAIFITINLSINYK